MIKKVNGNNNLVISHIADIDGLSCVILGKLVHNDIDIILCEPIELEEIMHSILGMQYDNIYITDLSIKNLELYEFIDSNFKNILHFDHHPCSLDISNYSWSNVVTNIDKFLPSGTSLFYEYLYEKYQHNKYINSNYTKTFVDAVRSYDTWDFKNTGNLTGKHLTEIFSIVGIDEFIDRYYDRIVSNFDMDSFCLNSDEEKMVEKLEMEVANYVDKCDNSLLIAKFLGYKVGISFSENYRSEVGNVLSERHKDLDFIVIVNFIRNSISLRTTNDINLNEIASKLGGGGHPKAAGVPINQNNLKLLFDSLNNSFNL